MPSAVSGLYGLLNQRQREKLAVLPENTGLKSSTRAGNRGY